MDNTGDSRRPVRTVRLISACTKALFKCELLVHALIDRVGLIAVRNDRLRSENSDRRVDNEARVFHLRFVKCLRADSLSVSHEDAVAGVSAPAHDKVCSYRAFSVSAPAEHDAAARICL